MVCRWKVDEFTGVGSIVSNKGSTDEDIQPRIEGPPKWRSTALITKTKLRVFWLNVGAVLQHGSEDKRLGVGPHAEQTRWIHSQ